MRSARAVKVMRAVLAVAVMMTGQNTTGAG
jgi:hypothetical protein